jgi:hypothetical protein
MQDFEDAMERKKMLSLVRSNMEHFGDDYERRRMHDVLAEESGLLARGGCGYGGALYGGVANNWTKFLHKHGGEGYTRKQLVKMYKQSPIKSKKSGSKVSKVKRSTSKRPLTTWNRFVAHVAQCNPGLSGTELMVKASKLYKSGSKVKKSGSKVKKGGLMYSMSGYGLDDDMFDSDDDIYGGAANSYTDFLQGHKGLGYTKPQLIKMYRKAFGISKKSAKSGSKRVVKKAAPKKKAPARRPVRKGSRVRGIRICKKYM